MINFKFNKHLNPWGKGFLTSVLGTTVSILLTFGTSALVDSKMQADVQRQTAMMVIHDIDMCVKKMEEMAKDEETCNDAIQYVLAHLDQIASLPEDTLELAMDMLTEYSSEHNYFDDAKENIFKSSQDIWGNLDNMAFIDNMERFYRERRELVNAMKTDPVFLHPISYQEYFQMRINATSSDYSVDPVAILKEKLREPRVKYRIDFSANRTRLYRQYAQMWRDISDRNKFIMNISDEELAAYIKSSQRSGSSVSKRDLTGQWERKSDGIVDHYYEFLENDSFRKKQVQHIPYPAWTGEIYLTSIYAGKWRVKDDTLFMECNPNSAEVHIDTTHISYRPEMRDSVRNMIAKYFDLKKSREVLRKAIENDLADTFPVTTNKANDKIEMVVSRSEAVIKTQYLKRIKDGDVFNGSSK